MKILRKLLVAFTLPIWIPLLFFAWLLEYYGN